jgi:metallophosphoesterase superfamily enzyme
MAEPSPPPIQIPLLIQEKLNFYIWQNKVKKVNNEYFNLFIITKHPAVDIYYLTYKVQNKIFIIESPLRSPKVRYTMVNKFTREDSKLILLPTKYNYTSGLNSIKGYKMSELQEYFLIKYPELLKTTNHSYIHV